LGAFIKTPKKGGIMKSLYITVIMILTTGIAFGGSTIEKASNEQINHIKGAMPENITIEECVVVKSPNHGNAYYIGVMWFNQNGHQVRHNIHLVRKNIDRRAKFL
jgi:hypothetical protein